MTEEEKEFLDAEEVAAWIGVNIKTVYDSANRGEMPCRKLGRRILFSRTAILRWFECRHDTMADAS